jgi:hypothetical protein
MQSIAMRVCLATVAISLALAGYVQRGPAVVRAQEPAPVTMTRLYTGADNQTHVEDVNVKFPPVVGKPETAGQSEMVQTAGSYVVRLAPGFTEGWHSADKRRYVIPIGGRAELEIAGGQKIFVEPGKIYLAEDLTGKGHTFRVVSKDDWVAFFVDIAKQSD